MKNTTVKIMFFAALLVVAFLLLQNQATNVAIAGKPRPSPIKEGFCQYFHVPNDSNEVICIVPSGERFVLRKLYCTTRNTDWALNVDDNVLIDGHINDFAWEKETNLTNYHYHSRFVHNFPDGCVVVEQGQTLQAVTTHAIDLTIIGYFEDL